MAGRKRMWTGVVAIVATPCSFCTALAFQELGTTYDPT